MIGTSMMAFTINCWAIPLQYLQSMQLGRATGALPEKDAVRTLRVIALDLVTAS